ncbi:hypothetical protein GCM10028777_17890 [Angustibacter speluncae]
MEWVWVGVACLVIGVALGLSGYGGFLVPPVLVGLLGLDPRAAVAHALLASLLPALLGAVLYRREHGVSARLVLLLCLGTLPGVLLGEVVSRALPTWVLQVLIGLAVLVAGLVLLRRARRPVPAVDEHDDPARAQVPPARTLAAGGLSGVAGVVVGVGGPLVTTPLLVASGVALGPAVGAGLANNVVVAAAGSATLLARVDLDAAVLAVATVPQLLGVVAGVRWRSRVPAGLLALGVALVAVASGVVLVLAAA